MPGSRRIHGIASALHNPHLFDKLGSEGQCLVFALSKLTQDVYESLGSVEPEIEIHLRTVARVNQ